MTRKQFSNLAAIGVAAVLGLVACGDTSPSSDVAVVSDSVADIDAVVAPDAPISDSVASETAPNDDGGAELVTPDSIADADIGGADSAADAAPDLPDDVANPVPTWSATLKPLFATYCVACHSTSPKDFRSYDDAVAWAAPTRCGVAPALQSGCGSWPPPGQFPVGSGPFPTDAERQLFVDWVDGGTQL